MNASEIVAALLEAVDPKDFVQRDPVLLLAAYFGEKGEKVTTARRADDEDIAAYFRAACEVPGVHHGVTAPTEKAYVMIEWGIEDTRTYAGLGRGGAGQVYVFSTLRDVRQFIRDLTLLEKAVTVEFNADKAERITDKITFRTSYSKPFGYADPRGRGDT